MAEKGGLHFARVRRKIITRDPQRLASLSRRRGIWRRWPKTGGRLFFDVKPVFIKAYGGRRWTSQDELILPKQQRTRGKFYLLLADNVATGQRHWAFMDGKATPVVCQFMRLLRQRYETQTVWVGLDQDRAHPCISRETRRVMRQLKLRYISLPKASPDDNPVETSFSDLQLMVLDNSNDPDARTTKRRISRYLKARNLCKIDG